MLTVGENVFGVPNNILWNKKCCSMGTSRSVLVTLSLWQSLALWGHYEPLNKQETICVHTLSGKFNLDNLQIWEKDSIHSLWAFFFPPQVGWSSSSLSTAMVWLKLVYTELSWRNSAPAASGTQSVVSRRELLLESHLWFPGWWRCDLHLCENNTQLCYQKYKLLEFCSGRKKIRTCTAFRLSFGEKNVGN